mgnify:CR=1 FL=1
MSEEIVGVAYPVPSNLLDRIFKEGKNVFIKHPTCYKQLKPGRKVLFYASHEIRGIVGEAAIKNIELMKINQIYEKYGNKVFITKEEAKEYSKPFKTRRQAGAGKAREVKFLVLELQNVKKYDKPVKPKRFITVGGKYITKREYEEIKEKQNDTLF